MKVETSIELQRWVNALTEVLTQLGKEDIFRSPIHSPSILDPDRLSPVSNGTHSKEERFSHASVSTSPSRNLSHVAFDAEKVPQSRNLEKQNSRVFQRRKSVTSLNAQRQFSEDLKREAKRNDKFNDSLSQGEKGHIFTVDELSESQISPGSDDIKVC